MPPRVSLTTLLDSLTLTTPPSTHRTARRAASTVSQKARRQDPYALAQARARKAANLSRQSVLREERAKAYGDPIHGVETPFLRSFDTGIPLADAPENETLSPLDPSTLSSADASTAADKNPTHLNHLLTAPLLSSSLSHSTSLSAPPPLNPLISKDPAKADEEKAAHEAGCNRAHEALKRITAVANASSKDRKRINTARCIETFGRHNTDNTLRPKPSANPQMADTAEGDAEAAKSIIARAGPDTGSSEVQIAILTAKIRTLAQFLETRGRKDKVNKRNLRLLVHRRQKLLRYLRRSDRGGERWQFITTTLGLGEGTWRGEISL